MTRLIRITQPITLTTLTLIFAGCAQPTRSVVFEPSTSKITHQNWGFTKNPTASKRYVDPWATNKSVQAPDQASTSTQNQVPQEFNGNIASFQAAAFEQPDPRDSSRIAPAFGGINAFGEVAAQALPTELDTDGQSPDTANRTQITFTHEGSDYDPVVTRDGNTMLFASTQHRITADIYSRPIGSQVITQITQHPANDAMPSPSPDGNRVAFASDRNGNWDIFIMPITGGNAVQITFEGAHELHPSWSPDGSQLVFNRMGQVSGRWEIWVVDLQSTGLAHFIGFGLFPEWCPISGTGFNNSDKIVFQRARERGERAFSIWTIDYAAGYATNQSQIAYSNNTALINPTWSPEGKFIAYASVPNPSKWDDYETTGPAQASLHMIDAHGQNLITLTSGHSVDLMPFWANSDQLFFVSNRTGTDNIWALDAAQAVFAATGKYPFSESYPGNENPAQNGQPYANVPTPDED